LDSEGFDFKIDVESAVRYLDFNSESWEIFHELEIKKTVRIEKGEISHISENIEEGIAFRAILDGKVGFSFTTDEGNIIEACEMAIKIAKISEDRLKGFPEGSRSKVDGVYFKETADQIFGKGEWLIDAGESMIEIANESGVNLADGFIELSITKREILNSSGAELNDLQTSCSAFAECVYEDGSAYDMAFSRNLDLSVERIVKNASFFSIQSSKGGKIESGVYDVVLSPLAVHQLLYFALYPAFSFENVMKNRSPLADKIGERIFGDVTIRDDGCVNRMFMSSEFDDEGLATRNTVLVEKGVLTNYLRDWKSSSEFEEEPTGNGVRYERNSYPSIHPTNMLIEPSEREYEFGECFYINSLTGSHTSNPVNGDFSLECSGIIYSDADKPIKSAMIYGNVYDLLNRLIYGGKEDIQVENTITPWLKFKELRLKG